MGLLCRRRMRNRGGSGIQGGDVLIFADRLFDIDEGNRDVVRGTSSVCLLNQKRYSLLGILLGGETEEFLVGEDVADPIATEEKAVSRTEGERGEDVGVDLLLQPQGLVDDVLLRVVLGLFGSQEAVANQTADYRVVLGQLFDPLIPDSVEPRIADVPYPGLLPLDQEEGESCAHAVGQGISASFQED